MRTSKNWRVLDGLNLRAALAVEKKGGEAGYKGSIQGKVKEEDPKQFSQVEDDNQKV